MRRATIVGLCFVLVLGLSVTSAHAADKASDLIVGKWEPKDTKQKGTVEFIPKDAKNTTEGKVLLKIEDPAGKVIEVNGTYKFTGDDKVEVELNFMGEKMKEELKVTVTKDELVTVDSKDKKETFKRVK
jgi:uncharacterized protein (TIGR03066 family)